MTNDKKIQVGIGFATGRKNFKRVLNTYIYNWKESGLVETEKVMLNLFIAYDLKYNKTKSADYTSIGNKLTDMVDDLHFLDSEYITNEINQLIGDNVINETEAALFFSSGYAAMRNIILYSAVKNKTDYLLFLDDDEYPLVVTKSQNTTIWSGQHVLSTHLLTIKNADITSGYHCGYVSPIPNIEFNEVLTENDFRMFIEAISNDIINWDNIKSIMNNDGITYADTKILVSNTPTEVLEEMNTKFISGANLCINLTNPQRTKPFYNPPGARGEDTFLSTCLKERKIMRIPCYTFHDGFSTYNHLLSGVLPTKLKQIKADSKQIINRFYRACIGWTRYKPLFLYITQRDGYEEKIKKMRENLSITLPKLCTYFDSKDFMKIAKELDLYHSNVQNHYNQFISNQNTWVKIHKYLMMLD